MKTVLKILAVLFIAFIVMALRPIMNLHMDDCASVTGTIDRLVFHEGSKDIGMGIVEDANRYYINRGLELGLEESSLRPKIMDQKVTIHYADHWTPLDPKMQTRHIARITLGDEIIYNEIKD